MQPPVLYVPRSVGDKLRPLVLDRRVRFVAAAVNLAERVPRGAVDVREAVTLATLADGEKAGRRGLVGAALAGGHARAAADGAERLVRGLPVEHVHGVIDIPGDHHEPFAVGGELEGYDGRVSLKRKLSDETPQLASLRVYPAVPYTHDGRSARARNLTGGHEARVRVQRQALDVVVVPVEEVLLVVVPVVNDADGGCVIHRVLSLVVEQVIRGVLQPAVAVDVLEGQASLWGARGPGRESRVPVARRVDPFAARPVFDPTREGVAALIVRLVRTHPPLLHGDDPVAAGQHGGDEQVHGHAPRPVLSVLSEEGVDDGGAQSGAQS